eukprot:m.143421 g.143421  ORF g.143421 m.143421 type:complete len:204 (-) comp14095_c0_seq1:310-921(-)
MVNSTRVASLAFALVAITAVVTALPALHFNAKGPKCPDASTIDNVVVANYTGKWYEFAASQQQRNTFEKNLVCQTAIYTPNDDGTIQVNNTGRHLTPQGEQTSAIGKAKVVSGGKFAVSFFGPFYGPYWIIGLWGDANEGYEVSLVWSCAEGLLEHVHDIWVLSRTPDLPSGVTLDSVLQVAVNKGIDVASLNVTRTLQDGCW